MQCDVRCLEDERDFLENLTALRAGTGPADRK
jgi:hypothetical protein